MVDINHYVEQLRNHFYERDVELTRTIQEVIRQQNLSGQISRIDIFKQIIAHTYQSASAYSNLIIIAGYAGLFGVWQFTRTYLSKEESLLVALLALVSVFIFSGFETYKMITNAIFYRKISQIIQNDISETDVIAAWRYAWADCELKQTKVWRYQIIPTVLTGYGAGVYLIYAFIRELSAGLWKGAVIMMTRQHIGIILTILGTICLAFSVKVTRQYKGKRAEAIDRVKQEHNLLELTETRIIRWLFWLGLLCVAVGTSLQW